MAEPAPIEPWLLKILLRQSMLQANEITPDARLGADLGLDSLDEVEIVLMVENEKGIEIDADLIAADATVADLVALIGRTIAQRAGAKADG